MNSFAQHKHYAAATAIPSDFNRNSRLLITSNYTKFHSFIHTRYVHMKTSNHFHISLKKVSGNKENYGYGYNSNAEEDEWNRVKQ